MWYDWFFSCSNYSSFHHSINGLHLCSTVLKGKKEKKLHFKRGSLFFPLLSEVIFSTITFELSSFVQFPEGQSPNLQEVTRSAWNWKEQRSVQTKAEIGQCQIFIYIWKMKKITLTPSGAGKLEEIWTWDSDNILGSTRWWRALGSLL